MGLQRQAARPKGRVITFYSYKGGTGRSMAVANVAWMLALNGERVLVVDWDLEAPGIHRYFHPFLADKDLLQTDGLLDFVERCAGRAAVSSSPLPEQDVDIVEYVSLLNWPSASPLRWEAFGPNARIDLLAAGRQGPTYTRKLNAFNWIDFYEKLGGRRIVEIARRQLVDVYDYVLIDSRTGVSDTSGICTVEMPDTVVVCFTLNDQSILGASAVAQSIRDQRAAKPVSRGASATSSPPASPTFRIFPVPTRVEVFSEQTKRQIALALAQQKFSTFIDHISPERRERYWGAVQLAYVPFFAFEEIPAVFGEPPHQDFSLTTPLRQIARYVTDNPSLDVMPLAKDPKEAEKLRKDVLGWYLRSGAVGLTDPVAAAESAYARMDASGQRLVRALMLRLVRVEPDGPPVPATLRLESLDPPLKDTAHALAEAGVVEISQPNVSVADKRIVEEWQRLLNWCRDGAPFLIWRQDLSADCAAWVRKGRDNSDLLRGPYLQEAIDWARGHAEDLLPIEREYIARSQEAAVAEKAALAKTAADSMPVDGRGPAPNTVRALFEMAPPIGLAAMLGALLADQLSKGATVSSVGPILYRALGYGIRDGFLAVGVGLALRQTMRLTGTWLQPMVLMVMAAGLLTPVLTSVFPTESAWLMAFAPSWVRWTLVPAAVLSGVRYVRQRIGARVAVIAASGGLAAGLGSLAAWWIRDWMGAPAGGTALGLITVAAESVLRWSAFTVALLCFVPAVSWRRKAAVAIQIAAAAFLGSVLSQVGVTIFGRSFSELGLGAGIFYGVFGPVAAWLAVRVAEESRTGTTLVSSSKPEAALA
jgi:MinD-like ATPase involved in chromosome partitioning or flagellar assembly